MATRRSGVGTTGDAAVLSGQVTRHPSQHAALVEVARQRVAGRLAVETALALLENPVLPVNLAF